MRGKSEIMESGWSGMGLYNYPRLLAIVSPVYNYPISPTSVYSYPIFITFVGWLDDIPFGTISVYPIPIESLFNIKISCNNTYYPILF